ncbi:DUF5324 family protein [Streptomyces sp. NPDC004327]|uniref:DUF5324 family protein n=1 Tax=unclassified Streptomyces TaxID=2593676 RepID=UPI00369AE530
MTRMESVRAATGSAKESVLHAADVVAPYAGTAKDQAVQYAQVTAQYAQEARDRLAPKVSKAASQARTQARLQYDAHVAPHVPPRVDEAAQRAAAVTRKAARQATDYTVPRVEHAVAATGPVLEELYEEAGSRSAAAWAALRGQVTPKDVRKIMRKRERRARAGRVAKGLVILGVVVGGAFVAWKWWDKQANPDWLVEPPAPTEVDERNPRSSVDDDASLDPEVEAKEAKEAGAEGPSDRGEDRR